MRKKWITALLCGAMTLGLLSGCGGSGDTGTSDASEAAAPAQEGEEQAATGEEPSDTKAADSGDMVTVSLYIPTLAPYTDEAIMEVQDAINDHLAENYGIQTKLVYIEIGIYSLDKFEVVA